MTPIDIQVSRSRSKVTPIFYMLGKGGISVLQTSIFMFFVGHLVWHSNIFCRTFIKNVRLSDEFWQHCKRGNTIQSISASNRDSIIHLTNFDSTVSKVTRFSLFLRVTETGLFSLFRSGSFRPPSNILSNVSSRNKPSHGMITEV